MPASPTKTLSPAELAKLEHAFAADPASDAYRPLAEAYLGMGRFMEAMVVCKKGVKAHPNVADPRVLLARVYAEQGKDKKALEEIQAALQVAPSDKVALRLAAGIQLKTGDAEGGKANLLKAYQLDPADAETKALMQQWKVEAAAAMPASPPPPAATPAPASSAPVLAATSRAPAPLNNGQAHRPPVLQSADLDIAQAPTGPAARSSAAPAKAAPARRRPAPRYEEEEEVRSEPSEVPRRRAKKAAGNGRGVFIFLLIAMPLALGAYFGYGRYTALRNREIAKALTEAGDYLKRDNLSSYEKAIEAASKVLDLDPDSTLAHGYLAYAYAIRWGELSGDDTIRDRAAQHLATAQQGEELSSHMYAAQALFKSYSGAGGEGLKELEKHIKTLEEKNKRSSVMYVTLGKLRMNAGDLEGAKEALDIAQQLAPDDTRTYAAMGTLYQRRGQIGEAWQNFDFALRYEKAHPESMLGKAFLLLERDEPDRGYIEAARLLKSLIEGEPPPLRRHLAMAHMLRSFLVSRVNTDLPLYTDESFRKQLSGATGVGTDQNRNRADVRAAEDAAFNEDQKNPELYLVKGRRLFHEEDYEGAAQALRKAIEMDGSRAHFHVELARALMEKSGGEKEAEASLRKALGMMPESPKLLVMLGHSLVRQNKTEEAIAQYERAVGQPGGSSKAKKNPEARLALGRLYRELKKDYPKSIEQLERAAQEYVGQGSMVARANTELGQSLEAAGQRGKAQEAYERALNADKDYPDAYYLLARLLPDKNKGKLLAAEYLRLDPRGRFAAQAQELR